MKNGMLRDRQKNAGAFGQTAAFSQKESTAQALLAISRWLNRRAGHNWRFFGVC
jgi:hypothetical protein